jgi:hypothetical protein
VIVGGGLAPAHVPPVSGTGVHTGEVARIRTVRAYEGEAGVGIGPGVAAVGGPEDEVVTVEVAVATILVHAGDVHVAVAPQVTGDLDVADEGAAAGNLYRGVPRGAAIRGVAFEQGAPTDIEIVPGNVHPPEEGRAGVVVGPARLSVVLGVVVNAKVGPASRRGVPWSGGLVPAEALSAAGSIEPHSEPSASGFVVQTNGVAHRTGEGALTGGVSEAGESRAAVARERCAGDVDRVGVAAS